MSVGIPSSDLKRQASFFCYAGDHLSELPLKSRQFIGQPPAQVLGRFKLPLIRQNFKLKRRIRSPIDLEIAGHPL